MKRVISYSLWGDNPTYLIGAIKNAEMAQEFYPDFESWSDCLRTCVVEFGLTPAPSVGFEGLGQQTTFPWKQRAGFQLTNRQGSPFGERPSLRNRGGIVAHQTPQCACHE